MAILKKKEFAKRCGLTTSNITTYAKRGKLVLSGKKQDQLDLDNALNRDFLADREAKLADSAGSPPTSAAKQPTKKADSPPVDVDDSGQTSLHTSLFAKQKQAAIAKAEMETKLKALEYQKKKGNLIPTDLVAAIISELGKSFISSFKDGADQFLTEVGHKKKLNAKERAELKGQLVNIINQSTDKAIGMAKNNFETIVNDLSNNAKK